MRTLPKPGTLDLTDPKHRRVVHAAYTALLSYGGVEGDHHPECMMDESKAKLTAVGYALRHWDDLR